MAGKDEYDAKVNELEGVVPGGMTSNFPGEASSCYYILSQIN